MNYLIFLSFILMIHIQAAGACEGSGSVKNKLALGAQIDQILVVAVEESNNASQNDHKKLSEKAQSLFKKLSLLGKSEGRQAERKKIYLEIQATQKQLSKLHEAASFEEKKSIEIAIAKIEKLKSQVEVKFERFYLIKSNVTSLRQSYASNGPGRNKLGASTIVPVAGIRN